MLLDDMRNNTMAAEWFLEPVDLAEVPDYSSVIPEPMDLGTVRYRLMSNRYASPDEFAREVRTIWQNAITYNSVAMYIGQLAVELGRVFDRRLSLITRLGKPDNQLRVAETSGRPNFDERRQLFARCSKQPKDQMDAIAALVTS